MNQLLAAAGHAHAAHTVHRAMSPTGVCVILLLALVVDYMSVGPDSLRDRLAFLLATPAFRDGFNGSPLDAWTVQRLTDFVGYLLDQTKGAYIAGAGINAVLGAGVGILAIYTLGCLLPMKASKRLGRFATLTFPRSSLHRINWRLWLCAFLLGILNDLSGGLVGHSSVWIVNTLDQFVAPLPNLLFGAS